MLYPVFVIILTQHRIETFQDFLHITDHASCSSDILIDLCRIYIDLQYLGILCKFCSITKYTVTETGTYGNQKVTVGHTEVRIFGSMHAEHACIQRMLSRKCTFTHQGITYRSIDLLCKFQQFLAGICCDGTAAHEDHRFLCLFDKLRCSVQIFVRDCCGIRKDHIRNLLNILRRISCCILGNIHQYRSWTAALCNIECTAHYFCQVSDIFYNKTVFGNRHGHTGNVDFLETVFSKQAGTYVTGDRNQRNGIHISGCNTGYQVGCTRTGGGDTYTHLTGCSCITICCMRSPLLMRCQNMSDLIRMFI